VLISSLLINVSKTARYNAFCIFARNHQTNGDIGPALRLSGSYVMDTLTFSWRSGAIFFVSI